MTYINLHTHHPTEAPEVLEIENRYYPQPASGKTPFWSVGLHPWYLQKVDWREAERWLEEQVALPECLAIGETGLDKVSTTPWDRQISAYQLCLKVAATSGKPLVIHCVRAFAETLQLLPPALAPRSVFHGFDKHRQTAKMLLDAGCYLSFGAALFRGNSNAAGVLRQIPADRFFLETDDEAQDIHAIYQRAAALRSVTVEEVVEQVAQNFERLTGLK